MNLESTASTARTLNLNSVWKNSGGNDEWRQNPLFRNPLLNKSIIMKHRLRANEVDLFASFRQSATKVIFPINDTDLRLGARYMFVGQRGYDDLLNEIGIDLTSKHLNDIRDADTLGIIDGLPSLDPFLMREVLARRGFKPSRSYFEISEADSRQMFSFLRQELEPLIGLSFQDLDVKSDDRTSKLATKILANSADAEMEPFRIGLGMSKTEFQEGVFCWKGFIYYKWVLTELLPKVRPIAGEISSIRIVGKCDIDDKIYIDKARAGLEKMVRQACITVSKTLKVYEDAYFEMTRNGKPQAFREFLQIAPTLFYELGERLGGLQHIVTFWRYRFPERTPLRATGEELADILMDFDGTLGALSPSSEAPTWI